jgi:transcriptional regulator with XRE-family HTH domain
VTDWEKGRTSSYFNYLYEIAAKYGVSVEWLKGETDDPAPKATQENTARQLDRLLADMSREELTALLVRASALLLEKDK